MTHGIQPFPYGVLRVLRRDLLGFVQLASMLSCQINFDKASNRIDRDIRRRTPLVLRPLYRNIRIRELNRYLR